MGGGGGKSSSSTTTSTNAPQTTTTTDTTNTANGNLAPIYSGQTVTVNGIDNQAVQAVLDANTADIANGLNLINNTQSGAADLISKALGLAAATEGGAASVIASLASPIPATSNPATMNGQTDTANALTSGSMPLVLAGGAIVLYMIFKKGHKK
ncbi:MAG: hypothetical protein ACREGF_01450 [Candidatus Saccharimonadales bacterium]